MDTVHKLYGTQCAVRLLTGQYRSFKEHIVSKHFTEVLTQFGARIGMPDLHLNPLGQCSLQFDAMPLHIVLVRDIEKVLCYCPLGQLHADNAMPIALDLLAANSFYAGTTGATIGWDRTTQQCHLSRYLDSETITINAFEHVVQHMVQTAEQWAQRISQAAHTVGGATDHTPLPAAQTIPPAPSAPFSMVGHLA